METGSALLQVSKYGDIDTDQYNEQRDQIGGWAQCQEEGFAADTGDDDNQAEKHLFPGSGGPGFGPTPRAR